MRDYRELKVWQLAHAFLLRLYRVTRALPQIERYGLTAQLRRAALSVPTNIVEGSKRVSQAEFAHFLNIAQGSLAETEYLLMVAHDLDYLDGDQYDALAADALNLARMLQALRGRVQNAITPGSSYQLPATGYQPSPPR
jgi:four helix bundle protein